MRSCTTAWQPSSRVQAPAALAAAITGAGSRIAPVTLDMWLSATTRVLGPISFSPASTSMLPSSRTGMKRSTTPFLSRRKCQGMILA